MSGGSLETWSSPPQVLGVVLTYNYMYWRWVQTEIQLFWDVKRLRVSLLYMWLGLFSTLVLTKSAAKKFQKKSKSYARIVRVYVPCCLSEHYRTTTYPSTSLPKTFLPSLSCEKHNKMLTQCSSCNFQATLYYMREGNYISSPHIHNWLMSGKLYTCTINHIFRAEILTISFMT